MRREVLGHQKLDKKHALTSYTERLVGISAYNTKCFYRSPLHCTEPCLKLAEDNIKLTTLPYKMKRKTLKYRFTLTVFTKGNGNGRLHLYLYLIFLKYAYKVWWVCHLNQVTVISYYYLNAIFEWSSNVYLNCTCPRSEKKEDEEYHYQTHCRLQTN